MVAGPLRRPGHHARNDPPARLPGQQPCLPHQMRYGRPHPPGRMVYHNAALAFAPRGRSGTVGVPAPPGALIVRICDIDDGFVDSWSRTDQCLRLGHPGAGGMMRKVPLIDGNGNLTFEAGPHQGFNGDPPRFRRSARHCPDLKQARQAKLERGTQELQARHQVSNLERTKEQ
jgi:hypothetical protein